MANKLADSRKTAVKQFFANPTSYLYRNANIIFRTEVTGELLGSISDCTIVDLGCGDGSISRQFLFSSNNHLTLVDESPKMLELAASSIPSSLTNRVNYLSKSIEELQFLGTFDVVLCLGVLAHVSSIDKTFSLIAKALKPKGLAVIQFTDSAIPLGRFSHAFHNFSVRVDRSHQYAVNRLSNFKLAQLASNFGLREMTRRRYWPMLPGMSHLPMAINLAILRITSRNKLLSHLGSEFIVLYDKV